MVREPLERQRFFSSGNSQSVGRSVVSETCAEQQAAGTMSMCEIKDLSVACTNVYVVGVIIAKSEWRSVKSKFNGSEKGVIAFTVRDSKRHFINCAVWGTEQFVQAYDTAFKIGDVVVINRPKVSEKNQDVNRYNPQTTSPFQLTVNEGHSYIYRESLENQPHLNGLISESIKSTSLALHLADVCGDGVQRESETQYVDLVVAVRSVTARTLRTKNGDKTVRNVQLMDTSMESIKMTLWSRGECERADKWKPLQTILHLVDVRCHFSAYEAMMVLQMASSTIAIENPVQSSRVKALREYIAKIPADIRSKLTTGPFMADEAIDLEAITDVMSVQKVKDLAAIADREFTAIIYAVITELDLDPTNRRRPVRRSCLHCAQFIPSDREYCSQTLCVQKSVPGKNYVDKFDIRMNLTDHSGTLAYCHMYDKYAATFLEYELDEYLRLPDTAFEQIRWLHLLERRAVKVLVKPKSDQRAFVNILEISDIDPTTAVQNLKTY